MDTPNRFVESLIVAGDFSEPSATAKCDEIRSLNKMTLMAWFDGLQAFAMLREFKNESTTSDEFPEFSSLQEIEVTAKQPEPIDLPQHKTNDQAFVFWSYKLVDALTSPNLTRTNLIYKNTTQQLIEDLQRHCNFLYQNEIDKHRKQLDNLFAQFPQEPSSIELNKSRMPLTQVYAKHYKTTDHYRSTQILKAIERDQSIVVSGKNHRLLERTSALPQVKLRYLENIQTSDTATCREDITTSLRPLKTAINKLYDSPVCSEICTNSLKQLSESISTIERKSKVSVNYLGVWRRDEQQRLALVRAVVLECVLFYRTLKLGSTERFTRYEKIGDDEYIEGRADDENVSVLKSDSLVEFCKVVIARFKRSHEWRCAFPNYADSVAGIGELTTSITASHKAISDLPLSVISYKHSRNVAFGRISDKRFLTSQQNLDK